MSDNYIKDSKLSMTRYFVYIFFSFSFIIKCYDTKFALTTVEHGRSSMITTYFYL